MIYAANDDYYVMFRLENLFIQNFNLFFFIIIKQISNLSYYMRKLLLNDHKISPKIK